MVELKIFEKADFQQLIDWVDSPEFLLQWGGPAFEFPLTEKQLEKYIENADALVFKVVESDTGAAIGHISLGRIDRKNKAARVGKVLVGDMKVRVKGIGQQMLNEILKIAFDELHLHRVSLGVFDFNSRAIACYEKAGFIKEGLLRDFSKIGDEYWSLWEMSILEDEFRNIKKLN